MTLSAQLRFPPPASGIGANLVMTPSPPTGTLSATSESPGCVYWTKATNATPAAASPLPGSQVTTLALRRLTGIAVEFAIPAVVGIVTAVVFLLGTIGLTDLRRENANEAISRIPKKVTAGASWNFKDSWATNLTSIATAVGAVVTAAGSNSALLPGIQTSSFAVVLAIWGVLVTLGPLLLAALKEKEPEKRQPPDRVAVPIPDQVAVPIPDQLTAPMNERPDHVTIRFWSLLLGGSITLVAVGATFATAWVLVTFSAAPAGVRDALHAGSRS